MKVVIVELFDNIRQEFVQVKAIIDTGASKTTIPAHIAKDLGIPIGNRLFHYWQANCPLIGKEIDIKIKYNDRTYNLKANCIEIEEKYLRNIQPEEECTRPEYFHPLKYRILLGLDFINLIPKKEKLQLFALVTKIKSKRENRRT